MVLTTNEKYKIKDKIKDEYVTARVVFEIEKEDVQNFMLDYFNIKKERAQFFKLLVCLDVDIEFYIYEMRLQDKLYDWCQGNEIDMTVLPKKEE